MQSIEAVTIDLALLLAAFRRHRVLYLRVRKALARYAGGEANPLTLGRLTLTKGEAGQAPR